VKAWRIILVIAGVALGSFGIFRLATEVPLANLAWLLVWLGAAVAIHDGILSPFVVGVGWLLRRLVPDRPRRYLQFALIMVGLVTVITLPMIYLRGSQPAVKALLLRNYGGNLALIIGLVCITTLIIYAVRVARDRPGPGIRPAGADGP
jgi:hypothetical protein